MGDEQAQRINISLPPRVIRMAEARRKATGENRSAYLARLVREDTERSGGNLNDKRWDPPKEKTK